MKKSFLLLSFLTLSAFSFLLNAQGQHVRNHIEWLKCDTLFTNSVTGIMVMDSRGNTVASWNPDLPLLTASTIKTISTGLILKALGPDYQFSTKIAHDGFIKNGVLYGNLYIVGGADPTLGSRDTVAIPVERIFEQWYTFISSAGIERINGSIVADDRFFTDEDIHPSWSWSNIGPSFGSGASGLSFCENSQFIRFVAGKNEGDDVIIESVYPEVPGMIFINRLTTSSSSAKERVSYYVSELDKKGELRGSIPAGKDSSVLQISNKFGPLACAFEFDKFLTGKGIKITRDILYASDLQNVPNQDSLAILGESFSPPLFSILNVTNRISNNFYAETFFKMLGKFYTGVGSYDSSRVAALRLMQDIGLKPRGYKQDDGSGLSRQNYVSARFFCKFFSKMKEFDIFDEYFVSFPQPGGPGTLKGVLGNSDPLKKSRIHAKSGSLSGVRCYAGYVEREDGEIWTFAILTNNYSVKTSAMQPGIEAFLESMIK